MTQSERCLSRWLEYRCWKEELGGKTACLAMVPQLDILNLIAFFERVMKKL